MPLLFSGDLVPGTVKPCLQAWVCGVCLGAGTGQKPEGTGSSSALGSVQSLGTLELTWSWGGHRDWVCRAGLNSEAAKSNLALAQAGRIGLQVPAWSLRPWGPAQHWILLGWAWRWVLKSGVHFSLLSPHRGLSLCCAPRVESRGETGNVILFLLPYLMRLLLFLCYSHVL